MKRKLNIKNLLIVIFSILLAIFGVILIVVGIFGADKNENNVSINNRLPSSFVRGKSDDKMLITPSEFRKLDLRKFRDPDYISYKDIKKLDIDLYSYGYLLVDLENRDVLFALNNDYECYPASLTKLITLDTILNEYEDLNIKTSFSSYQKGLLIEQNASLAGIQADYEYSIKDLLYALILPSGGDAAVALENLMARDDKDLIQEMNNQISKLGLVNTNVVNSTGLHDDNHYTTLDDLFKVIWDILKYDEGKNILSAMEHELEDGIIVKSTLSYLKENEYVDILGGKTGFTGMAGENIFVYYQYENIPYVLMLIGADGNPYVGELYHYKDVMNILEYLYK